MAENEVLRRIQEAKKNKSLDLNSMRLVTLPNEVKDIQRLRNINLYRNAFDSVPDEVLQFNFLENLNMYRNQITEIPKEISQLSNLRYARNMVIVNNRKIDLRLFISHITRILNLGSNKLSQINESLFDIVTLEELDLSNNAITILSPKIAQLKQLRDLKVFRNKLKSLPVEIGDLKTLKRLDISYNELVALPTELANLTDLQQLTLQENPLRFPPPDVVKRGRQAIQRYLKDDGTEARECEATGAGLTGTIVGQTATFTITSKNKLGIPKQVGGDRFEVTLVFLPDHPLAAKEELKVSSPMLNIPAGLVAEHLNNTNNNPTDTNNDTSTNDANDSVINQTEKKDRIEPEKAENGEEQPTKVNDLETVDNHDVDPQPTEEINGDTTATDKDQQEDPKELVTDEKKEEEPVSPKQEPVVIPPLDLPTKKESKKKSRPTSTAVSEKALEGKQLSSSSLLDDSAVKTKSNLETSMDVSALDSSMALDTSAALDASNVVENANGEKKSSRSRSRRKREKSSDKTADKKKTKRKHKRDRSKKKSPRSPRNHTEISHATADTSSAAPSENNTPRQPSRSNLKASSDMGVKRSSIPHIERTLVQTAPAAIVQQKIQEDLKKKKDERPDLTSQFVVTGNLIDNLDGTYVANYQPTLSGVYDMYVTLNGINIKNSPFRISVDADLRSELTKLKELFWAQKRRADELQKELNETKITVNELTDWLRSEEKAKYELEQQNTRLKNELTFLKQMAANMNTSQSTPAVNNTPKAKGKRRRSNRRSYHPSAINNFEESENASQKGSKRQIPQVSASNDYDGIMRQKSAPNWKRNRPSVRRENSEPVPGEPASTPSKPRYVPKRIDESVEQNTLENTNIEAVDLGSAAVVVSPRKRNTVTINDEKSNNESIASNNNSKSDFQAATKKRKSDKRRTPAKNKRSSMILGEGGEEGDPKKGEKAGFKEKLNFWRRIFDKKEKEVNYVRKGSRASKSAQNKEDKKSNNTNDKVEAKVEEQSLEQW